MSRKVEMKSGDKKIRKFEDIVGWQKTRESGKVIYQMTNELEEFRKDFGLKDQIRRAAVSPCRILRRDLLAAVTRSLQIF